MTPKIIKQKRTEADLLRSVQDEASDLLHSEQKKASDLLHSERKTTRDEKVFEKAEELLQKNAKIAAELLQKNAKMATELLQKNQKTAVEFFEKNRLIVENSVDAIIGTTPEGIITSWNGGAVKMFGYLPEEVIGKSGSLLFPPEMWEKVPKLLKLVKEKKAVNDYEISGLRKDKSTFNLAVSISPIIVDDKVIGASVVQRDITERKKLEEAIIDSQKKFAAYTEKAPVGIFIADKKGQYIDVNPMACEMSGYTKEELLKISVADFLAPEYLKQGLKTFSEVLKRGTVKTEVQVRKKNGEIFWISLDAAEINNDQVIAFCSDITERKKAIQHIEKLNEMRNKFISIISHQLRTPLTSVNWNLEMILNGDFGELNDTARAFLKVTHASSLEITHRIHDLLTAMDIEEGRVLYQKGKVSLDSITRAIINEMTRQAELKDITLTYLPPKKELSEVDGDSEKLQSVILKLIENAIIYTKEKGQVTVKLSQVGDKIKFEVEDTGIGIPKQEQSHIFDRFFRCSNASKMKTDSFGLGLFIAKSFIDQHSGKIGFTSEEGKGSSFWFEIPVESTAKS